MNADNQHVRVAMIVREILADPRFRDDSTDDCVADAIKGLASDVGWHVVDSELLDILRDTTSAANWYDVIACLFGTDCHERGLPCDNSYLIALLYDCLRLGPDLGASELFGETAENLIWSIVHRLRGVGYLSTYDPMTDPDVLRQKIAR